MKKRVLLSLLILSLLGCDSLDKRSAKVIDSQVEGLEYQCAGLIEYTNKDGNLSCAHMPLALKVGEIKLGIIREIPEDGYILPQDIAGVKRKEITNIDVIKITTILQSLDKDKDPTNGIQITKETSNKLKVFIDIKKESLEDIKELIESQIEDINFTSPKSSISHLYNSMKKFNILKDINLTSKINSLEKF